MSKYQLIPLLEQIENAKKVNREKAANIVCKDENLMHLLVKKVFDVEDALSVRAAWVLEWITTHYSLYKILPHLTFFCNNLHSLKLDSAIRPCAKICEQLATTYFNALEIPLKHHLKSNHKKQIIAVGFDWLITPQKIAVRAYTMTTLFLFGTLKEYPWVHSELEHLIRTKIIHESKGCKARGDHILKEIKKHQKKNFQS